jgi:FecR protein/Putative zinc-finger
MTAWRCRDVEAKLVDSLDGRLDSAASVRLHAHIESCAACRERAALWRGLTPALRAQEPAPPTPMATRRMQIEIERQLAGWSVASPRRRWRWIWAPAMLSAAGALAIALLWARRPAPPPAAGYATVARSSGAVTLGARPLEPSMPVPIGETLALAPGAQTELAMDRGTVVRVTGPAHLALTGSARAVTLRLDDGTVTAAVAHRLPGETFAVATPDLRVEVRGTRFSVGKTASGSDVQVQEGQVMVRFADGRSQLVSAGQSTSWTVPLEAPPPALLPSAPPPGPAPEARALSCSNVMRGCRETSAAARASMREGDPSRALRLLAERGRNSAEVEARCGGSEIAACQDELRYLRAEALNQSGRLDDAIAAYRGLDRRTAPAAMRQNALYAAAQIERRRGRSDAARTDYARALEAAPRGALREEILIGAMETEELAGQPGRARALARRYLGEFPDGIGAAGARRLAQPR